MKDKESSDKSNRNKNGAAANVPILCGLFGGMFLGGIIGYFLDEMPLYTSFGMIIGMSIAFDLSTHLRDKDKNNTEIDTKGE